MAGEAVFRIIASVTAAETSSMFVAVDLKKIMAASPEYTFCLYSL